VNLLILQVYEEQDFSTITRGHVHSFTLRFLSIAGVMSVSASIINIMSRPGNTISQYAPDISAVDLLA
jgi:hypothetical protein